MNRYTAIPMSEAANIRMIRLPFTAAQLRLIFDIDDSSDQDKTNDLQAGADGEHDLAQVLSRRP
jgi:hypothetical protein